MPIELDDFRLIQDASIERNKALLEEYAKLKNGYVVLSGCEVTNNGNGTYTVNDGWVLWDYEPRYLLPTLVTSPTVQITNFESFLPSGADDFADGITRQTHQQRAVKVYDSQTDPLPSFVFILNEGKRLCNIIADTTAQKMNLQIFLGRDGSGGRYDFVSNDFEFGVSPIPNHSPFLIKKNGRVLMYGGIQISTNATNAQLLNLPNGWDSSLLPISSYGGIYAASINNGAAGTNGRASIGLRESNIDLLDVHSLNVVGTSGVMNVWFSGISWDIL